MSYGRYASKRDANEKEIIEALVAGGCSVEQIDVVDLIVERAGKIYLLEVKDGSKVPSARKLTSRQQAFVKRFTVSVVTGPLSALLAVGLTEPAPQSPTLPPERRTSPKRTQLPLEGDERRVRRLATSGLIDHRNKPLGRRCPKCGSLDTIDASQSLDCNSCGAAT